MYFIISGVLVIVASIPILVSTITKTLYSATTYNDLSQVVFKGVFNLFHVFYSWFYSFVPFEKLFWQLSPTPNFVNKFDIENGLIAAILIAPFLGARLIKLPYSIKKAQKSQKVQPTAITIQVIISAAWDDSWWGKIIIMLTGGVILHIITQYLIG